MTSPTALYPPPGRQILIELRKADGSPFALEEMYALMAQDEQAERAVYELANGTVMIHKGSPTGDHQLIGTNLAFLIKTHTLGQGVGSGFHGGVDVHLDEETSFRPDYIFVKVSKKHLWERNADGSKGAFQGAPDLVVEILSKSTGQYDKTTKFDAYAAHGVEEYWLIHPVEADVKVYSLEEGEKYRLFSEAQGSGAVESKAIDGLRVELSALFAED